MALRAACPNTTADTNDDWMWASTGGGNVNFRSGPVDAWVNFTPLGFGGARTDFQLTNDLLAAVPEQEVIGLVGLDTQGRLWYGELSGAQLAVKWPERRARRWRVGHAAPDPLGRAIIRSPESHRDVRPEAPARGSAGLNYLRQRKSGERLSPSQRRLALSSDDASALS
jgi:hypothetical protein